MRFNPTVARSLLSPRQCVVLDLRYMLGFYHTRGPARPTLARVGRMLGISRQRVHQIERRAIARLGARGIFLKYPPAQNPSYSRA